MIDNFWQDLKKPVFTLAPIEDVTDTVFRDIVLRISNPDYLHVLFSEFMSTDGFCHEVGRPKVSHRLLVNDSERKLLKEKNVKLVAQIWGKDPEKFFKATKAHTFTPKAHSFYTEARAFVNKTQLLTLFARCACAFGSKN